MCNEVIWVASSIAEQSKDLSTIDASTPPTMRHHALASRYRYLLFPFLHRHTFLPPLSMCPQKSPSFKAPQNLSNAPLSLPKMPLLPTPLPLPVLSVLLSLPLLAVAGAVGSGAVVQFPAPPRPTWHTAPLLARQSRDACRASSSSKEKMARSPCAWMLPAPPRPVEVRLEGALDEETEYLEASLEEDEGFV
jgi:hypothetical protein